jgi:hypothetical protein
VLLATIPGSAQDRPSWLVVPSQIGELGLVIDPDFAKYGLIARYEGKNSRCDVYVYPVPLLEQDGMTRELSLTEEAREVKEAIKSLEGRGDYDRVELMRGEFPFKVSLKSGELGGVLVGAAAILRGRKSETFALLFDQDQYRFKIRATFFGHSELGPSLATLRSIVEAMIRVPNKPLSNSRMQQTAPLGGACHRGRCAASRSPFGEHRRRC